MCEIVLCVAGPGQSAPMRYQANDIIDVLPDGWSWGAVDLTNPNWRILKFPGVAPSVFAELLQIQTGTVGAAVWRRGTSFNAVSLVSAPSVPGNLAAQITQYLHDDTRASPTLTIPLAAADVAGLSVAKGPITQANVIGTPATNVIG